MRRLVGVLVLAVGAGLLAASPGLTRSGAPVTVGVGSAAVVNAAAAHAAAPPSIDLLPGLSTAQIARIPVAPGPAVQVTVSGLMMSVQAGTGKHYCYDAFYSNVDAGCTSWTGNGGSNGIWVGPPGWTGSITGVSQLPSLNASGTPAFNFSHVYHLTLNLTGKELLWAIPHGAAGKDTWSGAFKLDFTGKPANPCGQAASAAQTAAATPSPLCPPTVLPTPSGLGQTVTAAAPPPGGTALITSPELALAGVVSVDVRGVSADDLATLAAIRHGCFVNFRNVVAASTITLSVAQMLFRNALLAIDAQARTLLAASDALVQCVALVDAMTEALASNKTAFADQAGCAFVPVALSTSGSGSKTRLRSFKVGRPGAQSAGLRASCTRRSGALTITVATGSKHVPLSSIVGPRLSLGIVRSKKDAPGGQLSVVFNQGNSTSRVPDITGSWANKQAPTVGPPWALTTSNGGQTLDATWTGGPGHSGLHGTFHGTLTQANGASAYTGTFHITEASVNVDGTASFTIDNANQIEINLQPNSQPVMHYTFVRTG